MFQVENNEEGKVTDDDRGENLAIIPDVGSDVGNFLDAICQGGFVSTFSRPHVCPARF